MKVFEGYGIRHHGQDYSLCVVDEGDQWSMMSDCEKCDFGKQCDEMEFFPCEIFAGEKFILKQGEGRTFFKKNDTLR